MTRFTDRVLTPPELERALSQVRDYLHEVGQRQSRCWYCQVADAVAWTGYQAHDKRLWDLIGAVSEEDDDNGLGLTGAMVVHKSGPEAEYPGPGFWDLAKRRGRRGEKMAMWIRELELVHQAHREMKRA